MRRISNPIKWNKQRNTWMIDYRENGKRIRKALSPNKSIAMEMYNKMYPNSSYAYTPTMKADSGKQFTEAVDLYYISKYNKVSAYKEGYEPCERTNQALGLPKLKKLQAFFSIQNVNEVTTEMITEFKSQLLLDKLSPKTVNKYITFFRGFFQFCTANQWIKSNPADSTLIPNMKETTPEPHHFSDDEYKLILENGQEYTQFFQFMYETGIRPTDAYFLTKKDFYVENDTMYINIKFRKNNKSFNVPISKIARGIVENAKTNLFPMFQGAGAGNKSRLTLKKCFNGNAQGYGKRYCKKRGIVMHTFRHTFAMRKLAAGVPLDIIAQLMGHSKTRMTELYARYIPKTNLIDYI